MLEELCEQTRRYTDDGKHDGSRNQDAELGGFTGLVPNTQHPPTCPASSQPP